MWRSSPVLFLMKSNSTISPLASLFLSSEIMATFAPRRMGLMVPFVLATIKAALSISLFETEMMLVVVEIMVVIFRVNNYQFLSKPPKHT